LNLHQQILNLTLPFLNQQIQLLLFTQVKFLQPLNAIMNLLLNLADLLFETVLPAQRLFQLLLDNFIFFVTSTLNIPNFHFLLRYLFLIFLFLIQQFQLQQSNLIGQL